MRNRNQQTQSDDSPLGIRTSVWLVFLGVVLVCITAITFLRPKTSKEATGTGQPLMNPQPPKPNLDVALNAVILKFNSGGKDAEVAAESLALISRLPQIPRASCSLIALISNHRIGNIAQA